MPFIIFGYNRKFESVILAAFLYFPINFNCISCTRYLCLLSMYYKFLNISFEHGLLKHKSKYVKGDKVKELEMTKLSLRLNKNFALMYRYKQNYMKLVLHIRTIAHFHSDRYLVADKCVHAHVLAYTYTHRHADAYHRMYSS